MANPTDPGVIGRRRFRLVIAAIATVVLVVGMSLTVLGSRPASAANVSIAQCNGINNTPGLTTDCSVSVVNTLTDDPATTGSVVTVNGVTTTSSDIVTSVTQCNSSSRGGGGTLQCSVDIVNNISINAPSAAVAATISQCNNNQAGDGLGSAPNTCSPVANAGSGATIFQCNNRTGDGGGLVNVDPEFSHCSASGTVSASLPVTVNQCNEDSADGGGGRVSCTVSITTNLIDTSPAPVTPTTGVGNDDASSSGVSQGMPAVPIVGTPRLAG